MRLQNRSLPTANPFDRAATPPARPRRARAAAPRAGLPSPEQTPRPAAQPVALIPPHAPVGPVKTPLSPPAHANEADGSLAPEVGLAAMRVLIRQGAPNLTRDQLRRALPEISGSAQGVDLSELRARALAAWDALNGPHSRESGKPEALQQFVESASEYLQLLPETSEGAALLMQKPLWEAWLKGCTPARLRTLLAEATVAQREDPSAGLL